MRMLDLSNQLAIGIDIGGTNTKYGIVNHRGEIIQKGELKTEGYPDIENYIDAVYAKLQPIVASVSNKYTLKGIGIGAPNGNYYTGTIDYAPNLEWKGQIPLVKMVTEKFGVRCILTNDANAAAVGEMMYGAARGMRDFIMITLGTGVGSGIVANGQLIYGHDGIIERFVADIFTSNDVLLTGKSFLHCQEMPLNYIIYIGIVALDLLC